MHGKLPLTVFLLSLGWYSIFWAAFWPGYYSHDSITYIERLQTFREPVCNNYFESFFYPCLIQFSWTATGTLAALAFLQVAVAAGIVAFGADVISKKTQSLGWTLSWVGSMLSMPAIGFMNVFLERDVLYSWLGLFVCLQFYNWSDDDKPPRLRQALVLMMTLALMIALRREAVLWMVFAVFALPRKNPFYWKELLKTAAVSGLCMWLCLYGVPRFWGVETKTQIPQKYYLNSFISSVVDILASPAAKLDSQQTEVFGKVFDLNRLRNGPRVRNPFELVHFRSLNSNYPDLFNATAKLLYENPSLFADSRRRSIEFLAGGQASPDFFYNYLDRVFTPPEILQIIDRLGLAKSPLIPIFDKLLIKFYEATRNGYRSVFWSARFGILLSLILLALSFLNRSLFPVAAGPLIQIGVVFLTAPPTGPKYLFSVYLLSPLAILAIAWMTRRFYQQKRAVSSLSPSASAND